jgi:hypothetical protein
MICRTCLVTDRHPGVTLDASGQCGDCRAAAASGAPPTTVAPARGAGALRAALAAARGDGPYDCLVCWSGGKDSTFVLDYLVRDLGLRVAAFTFDNTFLAPQAFANMAVVREALPVEHVIVSPGARTYRAAARAAFEGLPLLPAGHLLRAGLRRHGPACYLCGTSFHHLAMRQALFLGCRVVVTGFTAGQSPGYYRDYRAAPLDAAGPPGLHPATHWPAIGRLMRRFFAAAGVDATPLFLSDAEAAAAERLSFLRLFDFVPYEPAAVVDRVTRLGWRRPPDTDACSSNCRLNAAGVAWYRDHFGCHPYAPELSALVRGGALERAAGQAILDQPLDEEQLRQIAHDLGLSPRALGLK